MSEFVVYGNIRSTIEKSWQGETIAGERGFITVTKLTDHPYKGIEEPVLMLSIEEFQDKSMEYMDELWDRVQSKDKAIYNGYMLRIYAKDYFQNDKLRTSWWQRDTDGNENHAGHYEDDIIWDSDDDV